MSQANVEAFKRGISAMNSGNVNGLLEECDPDVEWRDAINVVKAQLGREAAEPSAACSPGSAITRSAQPHRAPAAS